MQFITFLLTMIGNLNKFKFLQIMIKAGMIQMMEIILLSRMTILMNVYGFCRPCITNERINITLSPSLFLMGSKIVYHYILLTTLYLCLGISGVCLWIKYDNIVFCCLTIFRFSFTYLLTLRIIPGRSVRML